MAAPPVDVAAAGAALEIVEAAAGPGRQHVDYRCLVDRFEQAVAEGALTVRLDCVPEIETLTHFLELCARPIGTHEVAVRNHAALQELAVPGEQHPSVGH